MTTRRTVVMGIGGLALAGVGYAAGAFHEARLQSDTRLFAQGELIETRSGALEFAIAGSGSPLMMIHGTGGGFDQGLLFAAGLRQWDFASSHLLASAIWAAPFPKTLRPRIRQMFWLNSSTISGSIACRSSEVRPER